jgi:Putative Actinobacterial Holin-X, holin superfamily III
MPGREAELGVGAAAKQVAVHAGALARLELELAGVELKSKVAALGVGAGLLISAVACALFMLAFGLAAIAAGLATALPPWAALLIVTGALGLVVGLLGTLGLGRLRKGAPPLPEQAVAEAKKTAQALRSSNGHG